MAELSFECPLKWQEARPAHKRSEQRADHGFANHMSMDEALLFLREEISMFNPERAVLSSDMDNMGNVRTRKLVGAARSAAALQLKLRGQVYVFGCDNWTKMEHNIYAIHLSLRAVLNIEKWGLMPRMQLLAPFRDDAGTLASSLHSENEPVMLSSWMRTMGLGPSATIEDAMAIYHRRAKLVSHDNDSLIALNLAMEEARKALKS